MSSTVAVRPESPTTARLRDAGVTAIYRGLSPERTVRLSAALFEAGIRSFEVTLTGGDPLPSLRALRAEFGGRAVVGAGTVIEPDDVDAVAGAGAEFVVSPHLDEQVVARTKAAGLVSVPGAFTPTEVVAARRAGADIVKIFPINAVGADYLRQLGGPLPGLTVMASGGLQPGLARECVDAGAALLGVGSHLLGADPDGDFDRQRLAGRTADYLDASRVTVR